MQKKYGILCLLLVAAFMLTVFAGCGGQTSAQTNPSGETQGSPEAPTEPEPTEAPSAGEEPAAPTKPDMSFEPTEPPVQVVMPEYELTYAGNMADVITWEPLEETAGLVFYVELSAEKFPIFTMYLNQTSGDIVEIKKNEAGDDVYIAFIMEGAPEKLGEADTQTFLMAQDIANDIISSLILK